MGKNSQSQKTRGGNSRSGISGAWPVRVPVMREFSSGGAVFRGNKWLVAASMPSEIYPKVVWRLPKGWLDDLKPGVPGPMASGLAKADEKSLQKAALREVREEGGIEAKILKKIETIKYFYKFPGKGNILKFVTFYLMEWVRDLPEGFDGETSEVLWLPYDGAYKKLSFGREKEILKKAKEML